jgi:hypothetical protein
MIVGVKAGGKNMLRALACGIGKALAVVTPEEPDGSEQE